MARLTSAAFARAAHVSKPAITQAVKRGRLVKDGELLDTDNPRNAAYLASSGGRRKPTRPAKAATKSPAKAAPGGDKPRAAAEAAGQDHVQEIFDLLAPKERAEIRRINAQARAAEAKLAREVGRVVERERVQAALARFGAEMENRLLTLGTRLGPQLEALFDTGGRSAQVKAVIDVEMADAIRAMKAAAKRDGLAG